MFIEWVGDYQYYRDGQRVEVDDRFGAQFIARGMAIEIAEADAVREDDKAHDLFGKSKDQIVASIAAEVSKKTGVARGELVAKVTTAIDKKLEGHTPRARVVTESLGHRN